MHKIEPYSEHDYLGRLIGDLARVRNGDFIAVSKDRFACLGDAKWLLFCTHPLREAENVLSPGRRPYLTFYAFADPAHGPLDVEGSGAMEVHRVIDVLEQIAEEGTEIQPTDAQVAVAREAATRLGQWVEAEVRFGASQFLEEPKYFVPIPVALVMLG